MEAKLQKLDSRLKLVGLINIGLMLVLLVCIIFLHSRAVALGQKEPGDPEMTQGIQHLAHQIRIAQILAYVCAGLMLVWMPARAVCLFKLKKLRKVADA